jgi:hypothetical protein
MKAKFHKPEQPAWQEATSHRRKSLPNARNN